MFQRNMIWSKNMFLFYYAWHQDLPYLKPGEHIGEIMEWISGLSISHSGCFINLAFLCFMYVWIVSNGIESICSRGTYRVPNQILDIVHDILYLFIYLLFENLFIYLAVSDLTCGTQGLRSVIQDPCCHSWTLAVAHGLQSTWAQ